MHIKLMFANQEQFAKSILYFAVYNHTLTVNNIIKCMLAATPLV